MSHVHDTNESSVKFFQHIIDSIKENKPLSFVRYGDGELLCMMNLKKGLGGQNADGDAYLPDLGEALKDSIMHPVKEENFHHGFGAHCTEAGFVRELERQRIWNFTIKFQDAFVFIHAGIDGRLQKLIELLNQKHSIFVAPKYLHDININFDKVIEAPNRSAYRDSARLEKEIDDALHKSDMSIVILPIGMSAIPVVHSLYKKHGDKHTFLDFGSPFDAYVKSDVHRSHFDKIQNKLDL